MAMSSAALTVQEAYRHHETVAAWGTGTDALTSARVPVDGAGVDTAPKVSAAFTRSLVEALGWHRHWDR